MPVISSALPNGYASIVKPRQLLTIWSAASACKKLDQAKARP